MNDIDKLIDKLTHDLKPVKPMANPAQRAFAWILTGMISIFVVGAIVKYRMDLAEKVQEPMFIGELMGIFLLAVSAAYASAWLSLPDGGCKTKTIYVPYAIILIAFALLLGDIYEHGYKLKKFELHHCIIDATLIGLIPLGLMIWMTKQGAPTQPILAAVTNIVATGSIGYIGLRLTCGSDEVGHVCTYHVIPFVFAGLVIGLLARRLYRW